MIVAIDMIAMSVSPRRKSTLFELSPDRLHAPTAARWIGTRKFADVNVPGRSVVVGRGVDVGPDVEMGLSVADAICVGSGVAPAAAHPPVTDATSAIATSDNGTLMLRISASQALSVVGHKTAGARSTDLSPSE
ncbi:MAG TPA: hypothetical protein VKC59_05130 [Candidatus Limnocylindrales bacterium]|nr:hypothetical protein [Candidatus Limnocylindrales bacterium]